MKYAVDRYFDDVFEFRVKEFDTKEETEAYAKKVNDIPRVYTSWKVKPIAETNVQQ